MGKKLIMVSNKASRSNHFLFLHDMSILTCLLMSSLIMEILFLTLLIPSYFGPTLYTNGGYVEPPPPPTISSTFSCAIFKFCKILEIPFKVSENKRLVKKSFVWLPWQLFDNMMLFANNCENVYKKLVIFKCFQKLQILRY